MQPAHFLLGVDSDGTAFDSMNRKHNDAFIPAALEVWPMPAPVAERFAALEREINLFSATRGVNRFPGLGMVFRRLRLEFPQEPALPACRDLDQYLAAEAKPSPATLRRWLQAHPSAELVQVLRWSDRADALFAQACEGLQPFPGVRETLADAARQASVAVISSAAKSSLEKDWAQGGLLPHVDWLMSQEDGGKAAQLAQAMAACLSPVHALMVGDTLSDGDAARAAGARFFPIFPGREEASWRTLRSDILPLFFAGQYTPAMEQRFLAQLQSAL